MKEPTELTPIVQLVRKHFPGLRLASRDYATAARKLQSKGTGEALRWINTRPVYSGQAPDLVVPSKNNIVNVSRPLDQWPVSQGSKAVQERVYRATPVEMLKMAGITVPQVYDAVKRLSSAAVERDRAEALWLEKDKEGAKLANAAAAALYLPEDIDILLKLFKDALNPLMGKTGQDQWYVNAGIVHPGLPVQALQKIFRLAFNTYAGVLVKCVNKNREKLESLTRQGRRTDFRVSVPLNPQGGLRHPPGINGTIHVWSGCPVVPYETGRHAKVLLPDGYGAYTRDPLSAITSPLAADRRSILAGQPGYIPEWQLSEQPIPYPTLKEMPLAISANGTWEVSAVHTPIRRGRCRDAAGRVLWSAAGALASCVDREGLSKLLVGVTVARPATPAKSGYRRMRYHASTADKGAASLLAVLKIGSDWALIDLRGILRNAIRRGLVKPGISTMPELLELVTSNPTLDPTRGPINDDGSPRGLCTFTFQPEAIGIKTRKPIENGGPNILSRDIAAAGGSMGLLSMDLNAGLLNVVASAAYRLNLIEEAPTSTRTGETFLPQELRDELAAARTARDNLEVRLDRRTLELMTEDDCTAYLTHKTSQADVTKQILCDALKINSSAIPWGAMGGGSLDRGTNPTSFIADYLIQHGRSEEAHYSKLNKKGEMKQHKTLDRWFKGKFKPQLEASVDKARNDIRWSLQRGEKTLSLEDQELSKEYDRLKVRRTQLIQRVINWLLRWTRDSTGCSIVAIVAENLTTNGGFFDGQGTYKPGWDGFFERKQDGIWLIKQILTEVKRLSTNRGLRVYLIDPYCTSRTCVCEYCHPGNRDGRHFKCLRCGHTADADLHIATHNIHLVLMRGKRLPGPVRAPTRLAKGGRRSSRQDFKELDDVGQPEPLETVETDATPKAHQN